MSVNNLAIQPDNIFTTTDTSGANITGTLLDKNINVSPYKWINSEARMGISPAALYDIKSNIKNLSLYSEYGKAQFKGSDKAININNGQTLGNRYFVAAVGGMKKCRDKDNNIVDQYYVVDGMASEKDSKNTGLAISAMNSLKNIDPNNISPFFKPDTDNSITFKNPENDLSYNTCTKIKLTVDASGNTDTNYVNLIDAKKLIDSGVAKEAFNTRFGNSRQQSPTIVHGYNGNPEYSKVLSEIGNGYIIGDDYESSDGHSHRIADIKRERVAYNHAMEAGASSALFNFRHKYIDSLPHMHDSYNFIDTEGDYIDEDYIRKQKWIRDNTLRNIKKEYNMVTGFFLGSITVMGLYIVFRLMDRSSASKFR